MRVLVSPDREWEYLCQYIIIFSRTYDFIALIPELNNKHQEFSGSIHMQFICFLGFYNTGGNLVWGDSAFV
jgi:hypothetical protein